MTDKPKAEVVSLKTVPKEGKPVEDKKYTSIRLAIQYLESVLESLKLETTYEVSENALEALTSQLELVQQGAVHDMLVTGVHKDAIWLRWLFFDYALCEQTAMQPYKYMMLVEEAAKICVQNIKLPVDGSGHWR